VDAAAGVEREDAVAHHHDLLRAPWDALEAEHGAHAHAPQPSFWPVLVAASAAVTLIGGMFWTETYVITIVGLAALFLTMLAWGLESFVVEL
jgi:hypothetical protein